MAEKIDWQSAVRSFFPDAQIYPLKPPMIDALDGLLKKHPIETVIEVLSSKPSETGGRHKFPFIRPDRAGANLIEFLDLVNDGSPNKDQLVEIIRHRAPIIVDLLIETNFFDGFSYPNRFGPEVAWFAKPGEDCLYQLESIKEQAFRLKDFLDEHY
jgi:hypothetical protein